jgi:NitT/TauT family transport system substrate-binding protein
MRVRSPGGRQSAASGLIVLLLLLSACAPAGPSAPAGESKPAAPAAAPAAPPAKPAESKPAEAAKPAAPAAAAPKAEPKQLTTIEFAMPWIVPTEYFYFLMADKKGYYREEGIEIKLNEGTGSGNAVKIVGAGTNPIGLADANRIVAGRVQGVPIKSIMTLYYTSPVLVASLEDKPIRTLKELVGKKLGSAPDSANVLIWRAAMKRAGIDPEQVNFVSMDPKAQHQLLLSGQVDATLEQSGVAQMEAEGHKIHKLLITEDAGFELVADSIFANEDFLKKNPELVKAFLRATLKGAMYAHEHPDEAVEEGLKIAPTFSKRQLELQFGLEESWTWTKFTPKDKFGLQSMQSWNNLQDVLFENQQIDKKIDMTELVDNSYLPYQ